MCHLRQVKASAGAGKTYELTQCFLRHLACCHFEVGLHSFACSLMSTTCRDSWDDMLAVTFTNAAAAEMRDRLIRNLKEAALGKTALLDVPLLPDSAACWVDTIMRDMSALNIRTIDSLLHLIVRAAALELGLFPDFQPVFTTEEALTPYFDVLMERAWQGDAAMRSLLRDVCHALSMREKNSSFLAGGKVLAALRPLLDEVLLGHFSDVADGERLQQLCDDLQRDAVQSAVVFRRKAEAYGLVFKKDAMSLLNALAEGQSKDSLFLKKSDVSTLFLKKTMVAGKVPHEVQDAYTVFAAAGMKFIQDVPFLREAALLAPIIKLARVLAQAYLGNQREEGSLPVVLIPHLARQVLEGTLGVPDTLCRLGTRLTHFLVDEFQDTSREQWAALRPLVEEALSHGGSLTWVGDVKQSIYGWRGAEPELFDMVFDDAGLKALAADRRRDTLPCNWRSRCSIIRHNNAIFSTLARPEMSRIVMKKLLPKDTPQEILDDSVARLVQAFDGTAQLCRWQYGQDDGQSCTLSPCSLTCGNDGAGEGLVRVTSVSADSSAALDDAVLDHLAALLHSEIASWHSWSDILILVRTNNHATLTADRLTHEGIPVITENSLLLAKHPLIVQTVAFLTFLDTPQDNIAFLTVLQGELFHGHPDAAAVQHEHLEAWCAVEGSDSLFLRFQLHWPLVWQRLLAPFLDSSGLMTPYDTTMEWYARLQAEQRFPDARSFLRRFMEVLHSAEEKGFATLSTFLEHWRSRGEEEKVPMPDSMDAVRVMTIHKSKGLESSVVILPWTNLRSRMDGKTVLVEHNGVRLAVGNRKALGNPYYTELARQSRENLHMLYVAFTRARDALYVFRTTVEGDHRTRSSTVDALDLLMNEAALTPPYTLGTLNSRNTVRPAAVTAAMSDTTTDCNIVPADVISPAASLTIEATMPEGTGQVEDVACWRPMQWLPQLKIFRNPLAGITFRPEDRGSLLHLCLEHLHITGHADADALAAFNAGFGQLSVPLADEASLLASLTPSLRWFASQPETAHWLHEGWPEHSLMDAEGRAHRVDLLINEPWGPLVLEYKSGNREPSHITQLRTYLQCLVTDDMSGTPRGLLVYLDLQCFVLVDAHTVSEPVGRCATILPTGGHGA